VPVGTVVAERKPISKMLDFVGRVEAINRVEIRARVTGYLGQVLFKEGNLVKEGAPLYRIEQGLFNAAVEQAQGALERSKAAKTLTVIQLQRAEGLLTKQAGTAVARDQALAADQQAHGTIMADEANLATAKINLGYTDITSPITGRIGKTNITKGNVVGPDSGSLAMIVSQDPMYVTFPVSQRELLRAQESARQFDVGSIKGTLRFADGTTYDQTGRINFLDVRCAKGCGRPRGRAKNRSPTQPKAKHPKAIWHRRARRRPSDGGAEPSRSHEKAPAIGQGFSCLPLNWP
jgi:membrane fusion protein (multidrug efflux system)